MLQKGLMKCIRLIAVKFLKLKNFKKGEIIMKFICVPTIVILSYMLGEILKQTFKKKKELNKLIPIIVCLFGGLLGITIYLTEPKMMFNVNSIWVALEIGIVSGLSSTGSNQVVKKMIFTKRGINNGENK